MKATGDELATMFESAPRFIERAREFECDSWEDFFAQAEWTAINMPEGEQIELINAHPRIGAAPATVSAISYREQGYDRERGTAALQERLDQLNEEYEGRFGFRFVVFVAGRSRAEIAAVMEQHLDADRTAEKQRALHDVIAIARSRTAKP